MILAFLPPSVLLLIWLAIPGKTGRTGQRRAFFYAAAIWGTWLALASELLGAFHQLRFTGLLIVWLLPLALLLGLPGLRHSIWRGKDRVLMGIRSVRDWTAFEKCLLGGLILEALLLLAIAWMAPPNTNDAMQYHLARVMHWLQDGSLAHYPAAIDRQLWQPPWAELAILNLMGLSGSDRWANLVQWSAFLGCWVGVSGLATSLGAGRKGQLLAAWTCALLPMGILQATGAQNDLVAAFWLLGVLMVVVKAHQGCREIVANGFAGLGWPEWGILGLTVGLGLLTKGTFALFVLPALVWVLVSALRAIRARSGGRSGGKAWLRLSGVILLGAACVVLLNGSHWARNWQSYGSPFGPQVSQNSLKNQPLGAAALYSNTLRNAAQQLAMPVGKINVLIQAAVQKLHAWVGLDVNEPGFTHTPGDNAGFMVKYSNKNEELAGSPLDFGLIFLALGFAVFARKKNALAIFFGAVLVAAFLLYSFFFNWQTWGNRLFLPLYVAGTVLVGGWLERWHWAGRGLAAIVLLAVALPALFLNTSRPVLAWQKAPQTPFSVFTASRGYLQFVNSPEQYNAWISLSEELKQRAPQCAQVGYWLGPGQAEYALWTLLSPTAKERRLEFIDLAAPRSAGVGGIAYPAGEFDPCAIISTRFDYNQDIPGYFLAAGHSGSQLYLRNDLKQ
ncbi:hypothetical protein LARV_01552 [Longilinea arvoryzae]|uniref:4-amino-4-deoxy-L-arabinose transferase n=1 Tax=Longilinea arvoryzae TaxID=360412 RepID=A0A0S7BJ33_9CHLR|nr:hypothetical protein [Longilinea arvoryzae]GAP13797.1 hypothetical protein LARV_01552 [Longilinea arvoryzae]